jgi:hypothetical protein
MKYVAMAALLLSLSAASVSAQETSVEMKFSGTSAPSTINLLYPEASSVDEDNLAGSSPLGPFAARNIRAFPNSGSTPPGDCSGPNQFYAVESHGGSVIRFQDNSLLFLNLTEGRDCVNIVTGVADCVLTFRITGGTGRFKNASGTLTMTETALPVLADASGNAVLYADTGEFTGTVFGVEREEQRDEEGQRDGAQ